MRRFAVFIALAAACGGSNTPSVRAWREGGHIEARWSGDAVRVAAASFDLREEISSTDASSSGAAELPDDPRADAVWLTRKDGSRAVAFVSAGPSGGDGSPWQLFAPEDFHNGELRADFPALGAGEELAVLLVNEKGGDGAVAQVAVSGTAAPADVATAARPEAFVGSVAQDAMFGAASGDAAATEPVADDAHRAFCVVRGFDFSNRVRKPATRVASTAGADFFVDDEDAAEYAPDFFTQLAGAFEGNVKPAVWQAFGAPTDVDANGKIIVLLTHELGAHLNGGWLIGYFGNNDLLNARDNSADCSGTGSNHGEIVYLNDAANGAANGYTADTLAGSLYPATLAHESQHLINLGRRCVAQHCDGAAETWVNEALSKVAEDLAGYGWNGSQGRAEGAQYLTRASGTVRGYDGRSLTLWEGDPIGNYQGAHSFLRFFSDKLGPSVAHDLAGGADVETALQRPMPRAMAEWATALLLSNENGAEFSYSGTSWSPFHARLRHLEYQPLATSAAATLRTDGLAAFLTGAGQGGPASVVVKSSAERPPHVVVVRVNGALPQR